jgi:general secretion pathway protein H
MAGKVATGKIGTLRAGSRRGAVGFTLLELLVVLAILGFAVALAVPVISRAVPGIELTTTARSVAAALREARGRAIAGNQEVVVTLDLDNRLLRTGSAGNALKLSRNLGISLYTATDEVINAGAGNIRFYPDGTSTGGRVRVFLESRKYDVDVNWITGGVSIRD